MVSATMSATSAAPSDAGAPPLAAVVAPVRWSARRVLLALAAGAVLALLAALSFGSVALSWGELFHGLSSLLPLDRSAAEPSPSLAATLLSLRLPRAATALAVGGLLALSGALLQCLLRNALADPYVLGVSGSASCAAIVAIALGAGAGVIALSAAGGALLALLLLFVLAQRALFAREALIDPGRDSTILLTGVMIASLCTALLSLALALAPDGRLRTMVFWLLGDLAGATSAPAAVAALLAWALLARLAQRDAAALALMLGGDLQAYTQGVATTVVRRRLIAITALATGTAVALAGAVGFVGFVAPHLVRRLGGPDPRYVLPAASLLGAILVLLADTLGRSLAPPLQLPVGALLALIGVPVFVWQLQRPEQRS